MVEGGPIFGSPFLLSNPPFLSPVCLTAFGTCLYHVKFNTLAGWCNQKNEEEKEMAGGVIEVSSSEWDKNVLGASGLVMVDFWAPWCGPCRTVAPIVEELSEEYKGRVTFLKLNTDDNQDIAVRYQVMGIPTLMFFKDGKTVDKIVGAQGKKNFKDKIDALLKA